MKVPVIVRGIMGNFAMEIDNKLGLDPGGEDTWVFFGWVCAARDSKLAPHSKKNFP